MLKIIIINEQPKQLKGIKALLSELRDMIHEILEVSDFHHACQVIKENHPDLVIVDFNERSIAPIDMLEQFNTIEFELLFTSIKFHPNCAKVLKYQPIDILFQPIDASYFSQVISRAFKKISDKKNFAHLRLMTNHAQQNGGAIRQKIAVPTLEGYVFLKADDIIRCEANGSYTFIHTIKKEKILSSKNIREYEELLQIHHFFRIHNSHLINVNKIERYSKGRGGTVTMEDGTQLEVASRRRNEFIGMFHY